MDFLHDLWKILKPALVTIFSVGINWIVKWIMDWHRYKKYLGRNIYLGRNNRTNPVAKKAFKQWKSENKPWWLK